MEPSRLSKIINVNGIEIKPSELNNTKIDEKDILEIKKLLKKLKSKSVLMLFICFLFFFFLLFLSYYTLKNSNSFFNKELVLIITFIFSFILIFYFTGKRIYEINNYNYEKGQYGVVKSKYTLKSSSSENPIKHFYINVYFIDTNTSIRNVICNEEIYNSILENSKVLVISFDNKTSYAIKTNKNISPSDTI